MEQGWIKLHRQVSDNMFLMHDDNAFNLFIKLLIFADSRTGQYVTGRRRLAELVNMNPNTVYKVLIRLEQQGMIDIKSNNKYSVLCIKNWSKYQQISNRESNRSVTDVNDINSNRSRNNAVTTREQRGNNAVTLNKNKELRIKNSTNVLVNPENSRPITQASNGLFRQLVSELGYTESVIPTATRLRKLRERQRLFKSEQLVDAAKLLREDAYMQGDNPAGKRYGTIDYFLRNDENIAKYLEIQRQKLERKADW